MADTESVLLVDYTDSFGGAFEQASRLLTHLDKRGGLRLGLVTAQPQGAFADRLPAGVQTYHIRNYRQAPKTGSRLGRLAAGVTDLAATDLPLAAEVAAASLKFRARLLHLNNLINDQQSAALAAFITRARCICTHRDFEYPSRYARLAARLVDHHVAISRAVLENLLQFGIPAEKIALIHDCVDIDSFKNVAPLDLAHEFGVPAERRILGLFGRLVPWKGHGILLQSLALILPHAPQTHALIVGSGSDPAYETELRNLAAELGVSEHVTFCGYRRDVPAVMGAVDIVLHLSTRPEPFGLVVPEGMAAKKPVVAMNEGGPPDVVIHGTTGFLVEPRNPEAVAAVLRDLLANPELRSAMGEAGRARAAESFSAGKCAAKYAALYRHVLGRHVLGRQVLG